MSTLIVHPLDQSTDFLKPIYAPISNKTIITGGINKTELRKLIVAHDRLLIFGHGSPWGLLSVGQFNSKIYTIVLKESYLKSRFQLKHLTFTRRCWRNYSTKMIT